MSSRWSAVLVCVFCALSGFVGGALWSVAPRHELLAQEGAAISEDAEKKIVAAYDALKQAAESLRQDGRYEQATRGLNVYGILAGGTNAKEDLETSGRVDPETWAGLYAGDALPEVAQHLAIDDQGNLTYRNKVVKVYSVQTLKRMQAERAKLTGEARPSSDSQ